MGQKVLLNLWLKLPSAPNNLHTTEGHLRATPYGLPQHTCTCVGTYICTCADVYMGDGGETLMDFGPVGRARHSSQEMTIIVMGTQFRLVKGWEGREAVTDVWDESMRRKTPV